METADKMIAFSTSSGQEYIIDIAMGMSFKSVLLRSFPIFQLNCTVIVINRDNALLNSNKFSTESKTRFKWELHTLPDILKIFNERQIGSAYKDLIFTECKFTNL